MLCDPLLKFTACCAVTAVTALLGNASRALDVYQVLTRFKNNFNQRCNGIISSMHRRDDSSTTRDSTPASSNDSTLTDAHVTKRGQIGATIRLKIV